MTIRLLFWFAVRKVSQVTKPGGLVYVGELHPFKQYSGSKARFETELGQQTVSCFNHHISDFTQSAKANDFEIVDVSEYFDDNNKTSIPRILTLLLKKKFGLKISRTYNHDDRVSG